MSLGYVKGSREDNVTQAKVSHSARNKGWIGQESLLDNEKECGFYRNN